VSRWPFTKNRYMMHGQQNVSSSVRKKKTNLVYYIIVLFYIDEFLNSKRPFHYDFKYCLITTATNKLWFVIS